MEIARLQDLAHKNEPAGRSRGGFTTKLHASCDGKGRPLGFVLTPGEAHDVKGFGSLFRMICDKARVNRPEFVGGSKG
jgi:Transposase DDE domain